MQIEFEELQFDEEALTFLMERDEGELMVDMRRRAANVVRAARRNATGISVEGANNPEGRGPNRKTWNLYYNINYEVFEDAEGKYILIGTTEEAAYAYYLETGVRSGRTYPFLTPALAAAAD